MDPKTAVAKLIDAGWSELRIAKEAKTNQPTINRIKRGASRDCMYSLGKRLVGLAEALPAEPAQPTTPAPSAAEAKAA